MDKDEMIKNLLGGAERNKANRLEAYREAAKGFCIMVNEFEQNGFDKQTAVAIALDFIKSIIGNNK